MGTKHSPAPWGNSSSARDQHGAVYDANGATVAVTYKGPEDAERIAAYGNACEGLDLPPDVPVGALREVVALLAQAGPSLAVAAATLDATGHPSDTLRAIADACEIALAALKVQP